MTTAIPEGRVPTLKPSFVMGLFGDRGSGKSAVMAYYGIQDWKRGRQIVYYPESFALKVPGAIGLGAKDIGTLPDLLDGATVLIDEIQELLSKFRTNSTLSLQLMSFFRQVRKRGASVFFTSNDPGGINRSVADQTDMHAHCEMITDWRCYKLGFHRTGCTDTVRLRIKDTQGRHGINRYKKDGRKGFVQNIVGISDVYPHYDTASIANIIDVVATTKADLLEHEATKRLGMTWEEFDSQLLNGIIPQLVRAGGTSITPRNFAATLKQDLNIPAKGEALDSRVIGKRLKMMGLTSHRFTDGRVYRLPPLERLEEWQAGLWSPADED